MPKKSESSNQQGNSSSEMIVISPNPRIEEILISNQPSSSGEELSYEARLNEKLKDLDLYEEDMTIQQKEELLEVVVASWETAEKEKTRRQFFQDYITASETFCNDQFEFTLQESEEISNAIQCTEIPMPSNSSDTNIFPSISVKPANEMCSYDTRESNAASPPRRRRSRRAKANLKEPLEVTVVSADITQKKDQDSKNQLLDKGISSWKPCLSPKDTPLISSRRPMPEEKDASSCVYTEEAYSQKVYSLVKEFDFARRETRKAYAPQWSYTKPYHLSRRGLFVKKSGKLDKFDQMIGVTDQTKCDQSNCLLAPHSYLAREPHPKSSEGAHYAKPNRSETLLFQTNMPAQITRSGVRYGYQQTAMEAKSKCPDVEILSETSLLPCISVLDASSNESSETVTVPVDRYLDKDAVFDSLLPKYNNISNETVSISNGPCPKKRECNKSPASLKRRSCLGKDNSADPNLTVNSSVESDSSDNSSVIDVETVVDDEINEFVLKRKMLQNSSKIEKEATSKRLKKS